MKVINEVEAKLAHLVGKKHFSYVCTITSKGIILFKQGRLESAMKFLEEADKTAGETMGSNSILCFRIQYAKVLVMQLQNKLSQAITLCERITEGMLNNFGYANCDYLKYHDRLKMLKIQAEERIKRDREAEDDSVEVFKKSKSSN